MKFMAKIISFSIKQMCVCFLFVFFFFKLKYIAQTTPSLYMAFVALAVKGACMVKDSGKNLSL